MFLKSNSTTIMFLLWLHLFTGLWCFKKHQKIGNCTLIFDPVCPDSSINFYLYTRKNVKDSQMVTVENITESYFMKTRPNKFILHGFNSDFTLEVLQTIKNEFLKVMDINVWMINYSDVSSGPAECYLAAVYNLPSVGLCTALFVRKIMKLSQVKDHDEGIHIIGFSLGGQLAGQVAEHLKPLKLSRITGLDPALPLFYSTHFNRRLSRNDADFVDVIHTNALIEGQLEPCGDIDFYVNGGLTQPSCKNSTKPNVCDHHMAPAYFAESIGSSLGFWSWPCAYEYVLKYNSGKCPPRGDHQLMGEYVNKSARGQYVLKTNSIYPYAKGDWQL